MREGLSLRFIRVLAWLVGRTSRLLDFPAKRAQAHSAQRARGWRAGVTIVIPERARPDLLGECLDALFIALAGIDEPWQVLVSVSDADPECYAELAARFEQVEWKFSEEPLGFSRSIANVMRDVRHDHVYLLNNDMRIAPSALAAVLEFRQDDVFAIASQIFMATPGADRVETGLTACSGFGGNIVLFDVNPGNDAEVKRHLYAGGGASLYRSKPLCDYIRESLIYEPAYWEDVEWGLRAWRDGWRVLFCPASHALHRHRATSATLFSPQELEEIFRRNGRIFEARNGDKLLPGALLVGLRKSRFNPKHLMTWVRDIVSTLLVRQLAGQVSAPDDWFLSRHNIRMHFGRAPRAGRPRLLCVTPFTMAPIRHGGARRTHELLAGLSEDFDIVLVSDEGGDYPVSPMPSLPFLSGLWTVEGRAGPPEGPESTSARDERHCWIGLREAFHRARLAFAPDLVVIEHAQLAPLIDMRIGSERWWLDLHDVEETGEDRSALATMRFEFRLRYEHAFATTPGQLQCLDHPGKRLIANGSAVDTCTYTASGARNQDVLFVGNLRYEPNVAGLRSFIETVWPGVVREVPGARLLLAGVLEEEADIVGAKGASIVCLGFVEDIASLYSQAALTINPQQGILGSAVKVAESICAGRVCVATAEAASGWDLLGLPQLVIVPRVEDMGPDVVRLLLDHEQRHLREKPDAGILAPLLWSRQVERLKRLWKGDME